METPILQLVAYTCLTAASVIVAIVSALFGYRQNFGWSPIVLVTSHGIGAGGEHKDRFDALLDFEFWNRRKYPVQVAGVKVTIDTVEFIYEPAMHERGWSRVGDSFYSHPKARLEPGAHEGFMFSAPFKRVSLDTLTANATVEITYFDPVKGKYVAASSVRGFAFT